MCKKERASEKERRVESAHLADTNKKKMAYRAVEYSKYLEEANQGKLVDGLR